ncbi:hypothetical protein A3724_04750 [Alcanivorax sp. HI0033]|nr:hypothetical protein A3714_01590 [Alcanivorax sp. HI0007]KZX71361.1 hypothetical protein A3713_12805 [Alcanivorax sp. HI0003]KZX72734.1 hypothetical protein A3716_14295 [Alcanivorax sp. HI0011]KZX79773.1 hypothetical protein A3717_19335 [Alcanivorax sp. HI0013]KZY07831.1 hypothetical protein A3724_04750 [Alcanivorax sp. HI0033]KZY08203.1 hypothetical protein A3725_24270 [Alcanivorax sp. HI0035]
MCFQVIAFSLIKKWLSVTKGIGMKILSKLFGLVKALWQLMKVRSLAITWLIFLLVIFLRIFRLLQSSAIMQITKMQASRQLKNT